MNTRPNRTIWGRLPALTSLTACIVVAGSWMPTSVAETTTELAWRLDAEPIGSSHTELRNVRLASPTTYVKASRASIDGTKLQGHDTTVYVNGWRLSASHVTIDLRLDEVEITTPRKNAHPE